MHGKKSTNYALNKYFKQICDKLLYHLLHNTSRLRIITGVISESSATEKFTSSCGQLNRVLKEPDSLKLLYMSNRVLGKSSISILNGVCCNPWQCDSTGLVIFKYYLEILPRQLHGLLIFRTPLVSIWATLFHTEISYILHTEGFLVYRIT
jgi:hypothetical protein